VAGTDLLNVGGIEITANSPEAGTLPIQCVPNSSPVAEVLRVSAPYHGRWIRPAVPVFTINGWYRPGMTLHRPVWIRPGGPMRPGGWYHPDHPVYHPGYPISPGGWHQPGIPGHPGHPGHPVGGPHHHGHPHP
jgi:hypothetical protein